MTTAVVNLPDGTRAQVDFDTPEQLDATVSELSASHPDRSFSTPNWEGIKRGLGLGNRDLIEGGLAFPKLGANALAGAGNLVLKGADLASGGRLPYRLPYQGEAVSDLIGLPRPSSPSERFISGVTRPIYGAATGIGAGQVIGGQVGSTLAAQPVRQLIGAGTGGTAAEVTREAGGGPVAQTVAELAGGVAPSVLDSAIPAASKALMRGGATPQRVQENIDAFNAAGARPSAGQATQGRFARSTESLLTRVPGSAGVFASKSAQQAQDIGAGLEAQAATLAPKSSAEQAGRLIFKGISGEGGFVDQFKQAQGKLYDQLDQFIPQSQPVNVSNTKAALERLTADIPDAPNVSKLFKNAKIQGIEGALTTDINTTGSKGLFTDWLAAGENKNGVLPYDAVKKLRTLVGNQLSDWNITSDVPRSQWKALYGALSEDLRGAASNAGPQAMRAWSRANTFTRAGMNRIDVLNSVVDKAGGPERIFSAAISGTKEGATTLRAVMQSLPEDGQKMISATVLRRLGRATSGQQNELGDKFSTETFLTNWNGLSQEAKATLFDRYGAGFRTAMDNVARVAANLRAGSKVWQNPSGTGQAAAQATAATTFIGSLLTGHLGIAAMTAAGVGAANLDARLMTNPNFVRWLATTTSKPTSAIPAALNALAQRGEKTGDQDLIDAAQALQQAGNQ